MVWSMPELTHVDHAGNARMVEVGEKPVTRREAVTVGQLHGAPTYRWIPAKGEITVRYAVFIAPVPEGCAGVQDVQVDGARVKAALKGGAALEMEGAR